MTIRKVHIKVKVTLYGPMLTTMGKYEVHDKIKWLTVNVKSCFFHMDHNDSKGYESKGNNLPSTSLTGIGQTVSMVLL